MTEIFFLVSRHVHEEFIVLRAIALLGNKLELTPYHFRRARPNNPGGEITRHLYYPGAYLYERAGTRQNAKMRPITYAPNADNATNAKTGDCPTGFFFHDYREFFEREL